MLAKRMIMAAAFLLLAVAVIGNDSNTVLLLHCDGDTGNTGHAITINGTPVLSDEKPIAFGTAADPNSAFGSSAYFNGSDAYLSVADHADFDLAAQDFVIDFWINFSTLADRDIFRKWGANPSTIEFYYSNTNSRFELYLRDASHTIDTLLYSWTPVVGRWYHVAIVRSGTSYRVSVDGTLLSDETGHATLATSTHALLIGGDGSNFTNAYIDDFRVVVGSVDGWGVTVTVPTSPHTSDSDTHLLLHFTDLDQGDTPATVTDSSTGGVGSPHTVTNVSSKVSGIGYFWDGSMQFDGSTDALTIPDSADWDIAGSTGQDYTVDFWVKHDDHVGTEFYVIQSEDGANFLLLVHIHGTGIQFRLQSGGVDQINFSGGEITDTSWHHIALIKKSGATPDWGIYIDGTQTAYAADASTDTLAGSLYLCSYEAASSFFDGNIADFRIIKSNIFSATPNSTPDDTITVPTAPHTSDANTVLLTPLNGNEAIGSATTHDVTVANTGLVIAQESNAAAFEQSFQFDGSSDYLTIPDSNDWDIAGATDQDYTIDLWVKHDDHAGTERYLAHREDGSNFWELAHIDSTGLQFRVQSGGTNIVILNGGEITDTNWTHIALCKVTSGGPTVEWGLYKDGTQVAYVSDADTDTFTGTISIGASNVPGNYFDGYLDEIRIQKSNIFSAAPNSTPDDTITVPTAPYDTE